MSSHEKNSGTDNTMKAVVPPIESKQLRAGMKILGSNGVQLGFVDHMDGHTTVKLTKDGKGLHHYIPLAWVARVDENVHVDRAGEQAMREWKTEAPKV